MPLHHFGRILLLSFTSCYFRKCYFEKLRPIFFLLWYSRLTVFGFRLWLCSVYHITWKKESLIREENDFRFFTETWAKFIYLPYLSLPAIPTAYRKATSKQTLMQCNEDMEMFLSRCSFTEYLDPLRLHKSCRRSWSLDFFKKCLIVFLHVGE